MSMILEPFCIPVGFFVDKEVSAHIMLAYDRERNDVAPEIQKIIDAGQFNDMAHAGTLPDEYGVDSTVFDILMHKPATSHCMYANSMNGTIKTIAGGHPDPFDLTVEEKMVICIPALKEPSLFSAAYSSFHELVDEFKGIFTDILPNDFDYVKHIVVVVVDGTDFH